MDGNKLEVLCQFIAKGFALIPLHNPVRTDDGRVVCSCRLGPDCPPSSIGKHPRNTAWQTGGWVTDAETLASITADRPEWNWGAVMGEASMHWALDVDTHGGPLPELVQEWASISQPIICRTGSGGWHLIFRIGDDGWMPPKNSVKELGPELDVRAEGGQIVLPGSVSASGAYELVSWGEGWQAPTTLRAAVDVAFSARFSAGNEGLSWGNSESGNGGRTERTPENAAETLDRDRVESYVSAGVGAMLDEAAGAVEGSRNATAFRTACRIIELCNLMSAVEPDLGGAWLEDFGNEWGEVLTSTGLTLAEVRQVWSSARRKIGDRRAALPESVLGGDAVPFASSAGSSYGDLFAEEEISSSSGVTSTVSSGPPESARSKSAAPDREAIRRWLFDNMSDAEELDDLPVRKPLIKDTLMLDSVTYLVGQPKGFKSFVAIDWACRVATGTPWMGRAVRKGRVLYVAAEGKTGISRRVQAWRKAHGVGIPRQDLIVLHAPVQVAGGRRGELSVEWDVFGEVCAEIAPSLIVLDTQSRMTLGLAENDNSDMAVWIEGARRIHARTGACVLVVHHTGKDGAGARGGSSLRGGYDTMWKVERHDKSLDARLELADDKDGEDGITMDLRMEVVELGETEDGDPISSLVVRAGEHYAPPTIYEDVAALPELQVEVVRVMREVVSPESGATLAEIHRYVDERRRQSAVQRHKKFAPRSKSGVLKALRALKDAGHVEQLSASRWVVLGFDNSA